MMHTDASPLAGKPVQVDLGEGEIAYFNVEDWWDRVAGQSWMHSNGNPAALKYAVRGAIKRLPLDDEVVYGKWLNGLGDLVHVSEVRA